MPVDYSKGKIYKIVDRATAECYIGSTCEPTLARRLANHVADYNSYLKGKQHYITSFKVLERTNYDIQLIESFPCENKDELHAREGYWIQTIDCVNKVIPKRTSKQYYDENKDHLCEQKKQYYEDNKDKMLKKNKEYYQKNKDIMLEKNKGYYQKNKERILAQQKQNREKNKNK